MISGPIIQDSGPTGPKRVFISQPLNGVPAERVAEVYAKAKEICEARGCVVVERSTVTNMRGNALFYLAQALMVMSTCDAVYFCEHWRCARGCLIEHMVAQYYGLECLNDGTTLTGRGRRKGEWATL